MPKTKLHVTEERKERAILVTAELSGDDSWATEDKARELKILAVSSGVEVVDEVSAKRRAFNPKLLIGKGKAYEVVDLITESEANVVIFSRDLTPSQQKNLEELFKIKTVDRTQLILDVFSRRAVSNEGKMQVELAQLNYLLPRLSRMWLHLGRQAGGRPGAGGVGLRGPGEQQLEVDRRRVRERIEKLKKDLKGKTEQRKRRRRQRDKFSMLTIALVGYTNSGKSTLFNAMTGENAIARDQLFSTLDPVVRKFSLPNNQTVLLSDTVGFLHELSHHLIESFKATLEEVFDADILFHVIDGTSPLMEQQKEAVIEVLHEMDLGDKPVLTIVNKIDKCPDQGDREILKAHFPGAILVSALKKEGLDVLTGSIVELIQEGMEDIDLIVPHKYYSLIEMIRKKGSVIAEEYTDEGINIKARVNRKEKYSIFKRLKAQTADDEK